MKKIYSILLSLALVVSLGVLTVAPVLAVSLPSISPTSAEYDLDDPEHLAITITWGSATDLLTIGTLVENTQWFQFEDLVVITEAALDSLLDCIGDSVALLFTFDIGAAYLTVTTVGTEPSISPTSADWDFWLGGNVLSTITWGSATDILDVSDDVGSLSEGPDWSHTATTLNITDAYLSGKLLAIGEEVELTIEFNSCELGPVNHTATLTIEAVGVTKPNISPTSNKFFVYDPDDVEFDITWGPATAIDEIWWMTFPTFAFEIPAVYIIFTNWSVVDSTLIFDPFCFESFLAGALAGSGLYGMCDTPYAVLRVYFDDGTEKDIQVNLDWEQPSTAPDAGDVSLEETYSYGADWIYGLIDWGDSTNITNLEAWLLKAGDPPALIPTTPGVEWMVTYYAPMASFLFIVAPGWAQYYADELGDQIVCVLEWDAGCNTTFTLTSVGTQPAISPTKADFNLDDDPCNNVTTTVALGPHATDIVDVLAGAEPLIEGTDWVFAGDELTITCTYLSTVLAEIGDKVSLTIDFDAGDSATFVITAVGTPMCFIATAAYGTPMAEEIQILREFRDRYLLTNPLGSALVNLYYRVSPPIAQFITEHPALQPIVRAMLVPALALSTLSVTSPLATQIAILGLLLASVALAVWLTRRKARGPAYA